MYENLPWLSSLSPFMCRTCLPLANAYTTTSNFHGGSFNLLMYSTCVEQNCGIWILRVQMQKNGWYESLWWQNEHTICQECWPDKTIAAFCTVSSIRTQSITHSTFALSSKWPPSATIMPNHLGCSRHTSACSHNTSSTFFLTASIISLTGCARVHDWVEPRQCGLCGIKWQENVQRDDTFLYSSQ